MPLTQLAPPYPIFTDKNGDPLDAGYLYFGVADLNPEINPIQVYWDNALTQPAAQPIRTINGYPSRNGSPAAVYTNDYFSVTVRNKKNELVIYAPSGYGITPGTSASFTDQMTYNEGSVGAVNRVLTSRLQDSVSVKDFGAVGDGVTDDLAAFNAAVAAAAGGVLTIPAATYYLSDTWQITQNGTTIIAYGATFETDATAECVQLGDDGQRIQYTKFYGGEFIRTGAADYSAGTGFRLRNANWCVAELERISGFRAGLSLYATTGQGTSYCEAKCQNSVDCLFPLEIYAEGAGGFTNENIILGGRYGYSSSGPDAAGGYNVRIDTDGVASAPNMNRLYGCALESAKASDSPTAPVYNNGVRNLFDDLRYEGTWVSSFLVIEGPNVTLSVERNVYRNGRGLSGKSRIDLDGGRVFILGEEGIYHKGGDGTNAIYESEEANSSGNVAWRHRNIAGNVAFEMSAVGHLTLGENQSATLEEVYFVEQALVFGTVAAGGASDVLVSIPGVANSKFVVIATPQGHPGTGLAWGGITGGANQVRIRLINGTAAPIASIDRTWNIEVRKYA